MAAVQGIVSICKNELSLWLMQIFMKIIIGFEGKKNNKKKKRKKQTKDKKEQTNVSISNVITSSRILRPYPQTLRCYSLSSSTGLTCPMRTASGWRGGGRRVGARDSFARRLRAFVSTRGLRHCVCFHLLTRWLVACVQQCACAHFP